jgi:hypothetical protein
MTITPIYGKPFLTPLPSQNVPTRSVSSPISLYGQGSMPWSLQLTEKRVICKENRNFLPDTFRNTRLFHIGNTEFGYKPGALILLLIQFFAFIPDTDQNEIHTDDPGERARLEEEHVRKNALRQVYTALGLALIIWAVMGFAALML